MNSTHERRPSLSNSQTQTEHACADKLEAGIATLTDIIQVLRNFAPQPVQPAALGKHPRETEPEATEPKKQELALALQEVSSINVLRPPGKSPHLFETIPRDSTPPQMWLLLANDLATAEFSHTVSVLQLCLKDNFDIFTELTSLPSHLPQDLHNRLDAIRLQNQQAAALLKVQARAFSYR